MHLSSPLPFLKICLKRFEYEEDLFGFYYYFQVESVRAN
jgi:hypothetical protein